VSKLLGVTQVELAKLIGVARNTLTAKSGERKVDIALSPVVRILAMVSEMAGDENRAAIWFKHQPIPGWAGKTAYDLVAEGARLSDLTDVSTITGLGADDDIHRCDWRQDLDAGRVPATHALAEALFEQGLTELSIRPSCRQAEAALRFGAGISMEDRPSLSSIRMGVCRRRRHPGFEPARLATRQEPSMRASNRHHGGCRKLTTAQIRRQLNI
jgi:hypothetical protein